MQGGEAFGGGGGTEIPVGDIVAGYDVQDVWNHIVVTPNGGTWPSAQGDFVQYGSEVSPSVGSVAGGAQSQYGITVSAAAGWQAIGLFVQFSDRYFVNVPSLPCSITPAVYADAYTSESEIADFTAVVAVRRVGAAAP